MGGDGAVDKTHAFGMGDLALIPTVILTVTYTNVLQRRATDI